MPLFTLLMIAAGVGLAAFSGAMMMPATRAVLARKLFWLLLGLAAALLSFGSAFVTTQRDSGTGDLKSHGWPKPYYFQWRGWEGGDRISGYNFLYFASNMLLYAAILLALVLLWQCAAAVAGRSRNKPSA
jgi:hypothetical protein